MRIPVLSGRIDAATTGTAIPKPIDITDPAQFNRAQKRRKYHLSLTNVGEYPVAVNLLGVATSSDSSPYILPGTTLGLVCSYIAEQVKDDTDAGAADENKVRATVDANAAGATSAVIYEWYRDTSRR